MELLPRFIRDNRSMRIVRLLLTHAVCLMLATGPVFIDGARMQLATCEEAPADPCSEEEAEGALESNLVVQRSVCPSRQLRLSAADDLLSIERDLRPTMHRSRCSTPIAISRSLFSMRC